MNDYKIIFSGPVGAGKTTAIGAISDIEPIATDEVVSEPAEASKSLTTVALDYGLIKLAENERIHLYGTPGQDRFDFMWEVLTHGSIGLILLLSNARPDPFSDLRFFLDAFKDFIGETKLVIGVTQMDLMPRPTLEEYYLQLNNDTAKIPVFEVDARMKHDVSLLVEVLLYSVDPGLGR
jgi:uncharacterized protein